MAEMETYKVDKNLCIDCNACYTTYPEVFKQVPWEGETKAEAHSPVTEGKYNPWDVVGCCPVDAISKEGEMPEKPEGAEGAEDLKPLEDLGPWEERWERVKDQPESKWEVMKRYGMAATFTEEKDRYIVRMQFPEKAPHHILAYKSGLPSEMPDYKYEVELNKDTNELIVKGYVSDGHFKKLTGKINSFPDRFRRVFKLPQPAEITRQGYRSKILNVELTKLKAEALN